MSGFTAFDIGVVVILAVSLLTGFSRGFTREAFILAAWALAVFATGLALPYTAPWVAAVVPWDFAADVAAMVVTFLIALWILSAIGRKLSERIKTSFIAPLDRALGSLFGLGRGAFIVSVCYIAITFVMPEKDGWDWVEKARLKNAAATGAGIVTDIAPGVFKTAKKAVTGAKEIDGKEILATVKGWLPGSGEKDKAATYSEKDREKLDELVEDTAENASGS
jgi:membrane protein required for colicin V production